MNLITLNNGNLWLNRTNQPEIIVDYKVMTYTIMQRLYSTLKFSRSILNAVHY